ncbi:MAG TPA: hypothetical protein VFS00_03685 [Polyangiaceae bacterium]|nr:hypothetical protein [Polyangiaceae bacterium]
MASLALTLVLAVIVLLASRWAYKLTVRSMARLLESMVGGVAGGQAVTWQPSKSVARPSFTMPVSQPSPAELARRFEGRVRPAVAVVF